MTREWLEEQVQLTSDAKIVGVTFNPHLHMVEIHYVSDDAPLMPEGTESPWDEWRPDPA